MADKGRAVRQAPYTAAKSEDHELLEELAEDMLQVRSALAGISAAVQQMGARLEQLEPIAAGARMTAQNVELLRRDLVGDRKELATHSVFMSIAQTLDTMRLLYEHLDGGADEALVNQMQSVLLNLRAIITLFGYSEFNVEPGSPFDPSSMACVGYEEGEKDRVIRQAQPGYLYGDRVARPAGVTIADPKA